MVLSFRGTAHPAPGLSDPDDANLTAAEMYMTDVGRGGGIPILYEHENNKRIGTCMASWVGECGGLRIAGVIDDSEMEQVVRSGEARGLSLGTEVTYCDKQTRIISKRQNECSLVQQGRRPGCSIDVIDGKRVAAMSYNSKRVSPR